MPSKRMPKTFHTGDAIPASGIYRVTHNQHRLPHEVTLLIGNNFPRCEQCDGAVRFKILRSVEEDNFLVSLYVLPVAS